MEEIHHLARERIGMAFKKMETRYDARATGHEFQEDDKVWLWNPKRRKGLSPKLQTNWEERSHDGGARRVPYCGDYQIGTCQTKSVCEGAPESESIRRASAFISRQFSSFFWSGLFPEIQSVFLIGLESEEGYPLAVSVISQAQEIPPKHPIP
ncbi:kinectin [Trichonephila clavipes]|nr:kinectin [Trichonephila clavipes]